MDIMTIYTEESERKTPLYNVLMCQAIELGVLLKQTMVIVSKYHLIEKREKGGSIFP